ncbi:MAG: fucose isomerase [Prevotellaceae bacterium]|jgi:L-fucose isomerase-like protein|nr:fucose isomerase [Prevotellaceae bacterium]
MAYNSNLTFGLIVGTRNIFSAKIAQASRSVLLQKLEQLGYGYVILPVEETPTGCIETYHDALKCAKLFAEKRSSIDGIIVALPNFGDEVSIVTAIANAHLNVPIMVQACDDDNDKVDVYSRRDAFCGKISVCNNFYQHGIPFTDTTFHTQPLESETFDSDVRRFAGVCRVANGLRKARIGAIGARPAGFQTVRVSEKLLQASGITVVPVDLSEIIAAANKLDGDADVRKKTAAIKAYGKIPTRIAEDKIVRQAKFGVAVERWIAANDIDAAALQCWDSLEKNFGCAACVTMSMLGENLIPCACEVDIAGAASMYALMLASGAPPALLDWNNNFAQDRNKCVCTHCGNYPKSFLQTEPEISTLDVLGTILGHEDTFGAVKGKVAPGPFSFFRISTDDTEGCIKAYVGEGRLTADPYGMDGGIAVTQVDNLQQLLKFICKNGFEHHVAMGRGNFADIIEEATVSYLKWKVYRHE